MAIKAATGTVVETHEQDVHGHAYAVEAVFADYGSLAEAFDAHGAFLSHPRYARARAVASDPKAYARALQRCGYATDVQYAAKLISVMSAHDLYAIDVTPGRTPAPATPFAKPSDVTPHGRPLSKPKLATAAVAVAGAGAAAAGVGQAGHPAVWIGALLAIGGLAAFAILHFRRT